MPLSTDAAVINFAAFDPVVTPAPTDEFIVRQLDGVQRIETRAQVHALEVGEHFILPQVNEPATPTLAFGDGNTGFYENPDNILRIAIAGVNRWIVDGNTIRTTIPGGGVINNAAATAILPALTFQADGDTGIGTNAADQLSLIAGGLELIRCVETGVATTDQVIIGPAGIIGAQATPSLAFGDGDTGFYENTDDTLRIVTGGTNRFQFVGASFGSMLADGPLMVNEAATATNPGWTFVNDPDTGIGKNHYFPIGEVVNNLLLL